MDAAEEIVPISLTTFHPGKSKDPHETGEKVCAAPPFSFLRHPPYTTL